MKNKYTEQGQVIASYEKLGEDKFLIIPIIVSRDDECEYEGEKVYYEGKLFDKPPTQKLDKEVTKLLIEKEELLSEIMLLKREKAGKERENKDSFKELEMIPNLKNLRHFIDGKITHIVTFNFLNYIEFEIIAIKDIIGSARIFSTKLLYLCVENNDKGWIKNNLTWMISDYSDGSGPHTQAIPCTSFDAAKETIRDMLIEKLTHSDQNQSQKYNTYDLVKEYEITLPSGIMNELAAASTLCKKAELSRTKNRVKELKEQAERLQKEADALEF